MQGHEDFVGVVQERAPAWRRVAYLICGDWSRADDLLQQALIRMYVRWSRIDVTTVDAYARKIITRLAIDESRRSYHRKEVTGAVPDRSATMPSTVDALVVREALQTVPPGQRAALVLRYYQGLSVSETARALGVSEGAVKSQTSRGLTALRRRLGTGVDPAWPTSIDNFTESRQR